jgi:putative ABC transport system substrate-binding protein
MISLLSLPGLTRQSIFLRKVMDARVIGERSDAVLRTAMPAHDALGVSVPTIGRREFVTLLGGAAALAPFATRAQQAMPVVGYLDSGSPAGMTANLAAFHRGLGETGYAEGKNLAIEYRWAQGRLDQLPKLAAELIGRQAAVIAATRGPAPGRAAKAATSTIPIVFQTGSDPVNDGLVASLNRPGGNVTGISRLSTDLIPKRLGLMSELVPKMTAVAMLMNPIGPQAAAQLQEMQEAARRLWLKLHVVNASTERELDAAFAAIAQNKAEALIVATNPLFIGRRERIAELAIRHAIPTMFGEHESVAAGGLMSYAASLPDSFHQVGVYVGRILKGEKPADLPILQPTKFELVINLKTAKAFGIEVPPMLLARADEVIE